MSLTEAMNDVMEMAKKACKHCYCRVPKVWSGTGPAPLKCCKCGDEKVDPHGKQY